MDEDLEKEYYNMALYGYHEDDEYHLQYGSNEFNQLHERIQAIKPYVQRIFEQLESDPDKFPSNFIYLGYDSNFRYRRVPNKDLILNLFLGTSIEEAEKYIKNTVMYEQGSQDIDKNYVMCFRRAIPAEEPLYDNFWTKPYSSESFSGLNVEQPKDSPIRLHSVIKVTSLAELEKHGIIHSERLGSEGEITIDPNKKFEGVLFQYKDSRELFDLMRYIDNGGKTRQELLRESLERYYDRTKLQGLPIKASHIAAYALKNGVTLEDADKAMAVEIGETKIEKNGEEINGE